jgi:hypothetical protein
MILNFFSGFWGAMCAKKRKKTKFKEALEYDVYKHNSKKSPERLDIIIIYYIFTQIKY